VGSRLNLLLNRLMRTLIEIKLCPTAKKVDRKYVTALNSTKNTFGTVQRRFADAFRFFNYGPKTLMTGSC
jgi:hypothetical protein